jgi:hypothetical protein
MAEQAFVAVNEFGHRLADVIASPGFRIDRLLLRFVLSLILPARAPVKKQSKEREGANNQQLYSGGRPREFHS